MSSKDKFLFPPHFVVKCTKIHWANCILDVFILLWNFIFTLFYLSWFCLLLHPLSTIFGGQVHILCDKFKCPILNTNGPLGTRLSVSSITHSQKLLTTHFPLQYIFFYYIEFCKVFLFIMKWLMSFSWPFWLSTFSFHHAFAWGWKDVVQRNKWGDSIKKFCISCM